MNQFDRQWRKLIILARQAGDTDSDTAPYGFATRLVALSMTVRDNLLWEEFERLALRGLIVAVALGAAAIAFNGISLRSDPVDDYAAFDPLGDLLDNS